MHILILADPVDNQKAGVYFYTKNLIKSLLKFDKQNSYSFIHSKPNKFFKNTNHFIIPRKKGFGTETYRRLFPIPKLIKKLKPDIILQPYHIGPYAVPKSIKKVIVVHDLTPIIFPKFHIKKSVIMHKLLFERNLKNADLILTPSQTTKKDIEKFYNITAPIKSIPLGIQQPQKNPPPPKIPSPYILYLGTIEPRKNLITLIDAFLELKKEQKIPHKLVLAGEIGWKSEKITKKAKNLEEIILTGYLSEKEKASYYKNADMFVYPSIYEGFGLPPLEAMSYGIPVICSTGGSLKEIFENHTLTFEPKDKEELKNHILKLTKNSHLRENLQKEGQKYAENFTWQKTAQKTLEMILTKRC